MSEIKEMKVILCPRSDTKTNWETKNYTLEKNELCIDTTSHNFKVGDGTTKWNSLPYYITKTTATTTADGLMSKDDKTKLDGIDENATRVIESTVSGWGFTKNIGTVTGVKINGTTKNPISGIVDLGTILTSHQSIKVLNTSNTTAQTAAESESINGNGVVNLHKISKTGNYNDLLNKPTIPSPYTLPLATSSVRGGIKIGYSANGANLPVQLSSEKAFVTLTKNGINSAGFNESYLQWGGKSIAGDLTPISSALSNEHSANRLAYINGDALSIEYSSDAGATWTNFNYSATKKSELCTLSSDIPIGRANTSTAYTLNSKTRITFTCQDGTHSYLYCRPRKLITNISVSADCSLLVEYRSGTNYKNNGAWSTLGTYSVSGWSGWNDIPLILNTLGGSASQTGNNWQLRLTYTMTKVSTGSPKTASILSIRLFGPNLWTSPSTMASTGHMYTYDMSKNVTFPEKVSAKSLAENGTALSSKYLGISAKAADSAKLNGQQATYYLNYNNLTNKPTIPSAANNGILTISVDDNEVQFTADSAVNKSITIGTSKGITSTTTDNSTTLKLSLVAEAQSTNAAIYTAGGTSKFYAVQLDKNNKLGVYVPWTDNNTNTAHSHTNGVGLVRTGDGGVSGTVDYKVALASETLDTNASVTRPSANANRIYPVIPDKNGKLAVIVPWSDTNTHYTTGLYIGVANEKTNNATSNNSTYIKLFDDNTRRSQFKISGTSYINVSSDANGNVTIKDTLSAATSSANGLMSSDDKDNIAAGATAVTESTVTQWGFTKNVGTVTTVKINGVSKTPTSGVVDLGTVLTSHQSIKKLKTDNTTAQATSASEDIAGSGTINLHKVSKTGSYSDLNNKPTIPTVNNGKLTISIGTTDHTFTANQSTNTNISLAPVAASGSYNDLLNTPTIPTKTSQLTNDSNYATTTQLDNYWSLNGGTRITSGDLNNFKIIGNYYCNADTYAKTLSNPPVSNLHAFVMKIYSATGDGSYITQKLTEYDTQRSWVRTFNGVSSWWSWKLVDDNMSNYLPLSGGTLTGNLEGQYLTGTWLRTTANTHLSSKASNFAVINDGWIYSRTASEIVSDLGISASGISETTLWTGVQSCVMGMSWTSVTLSQAIENYSLIAFQFDENGNLRTFILPRSDIGDTGATQSNGSKIILKNKKKLL